jgi:putative ABC transport system substrate-binding protein
MLLVLWVGSCGRAQEAARPTIAIFNLVSHPILDASIRGMKTSLAEHGYTADTTNFVEVNANAQMDMLNTFAKEILASRPRVIVPVSTPVAQAVLSQAPEDQPIVFSTVTNPADVGIGTTSKNVTGVSDVVNFERNLDLIRRLFPGAQNVGVIYNAGERNSQFGVQQVQRLAPAKGFRLRLVAVAQASEVADAARALVGNVDVFYVGSDNTVVSAMAALVGIAAEKRKAVIASDAGSVEGGAVAAVSVDYEQLGRKVGDIVARVIDDDEAPRLIPNVLFTGDSLILNKKSAGSIGLQFSPELLQSATRVIE